MSTDPHDDGYRPTIRCPLCGGPVHLQDEDTFRCAVGHDVSAADVAETTRRRLAEAMWMAIEALDSEAMMLRVLPGDHEELARDAERQAQLLREFGRRAADRMQDSERRGDPGQR